MEITINKGNWTMDLTSKIKTANNGDTIICHTDAMKELGERALSRMYPEKEITFIVRED